MRQEPQHLALPPIPATDITSVDLAFPANVSRLMPLPGEIPADYPRRREWERFQAKWFFEGLDGKQIKAKPGIDLTHALAHLSCIQRSFEPKHEDKTRAVSWLASRWLDESALIGALK